MANKRDQTIGWLGAFLIVGAYFLLTVELVTQNDILYNSMNLVGGALLSYRVWIDRNYSNLFLEIIFVAVAIFALLKTVL